MNKKANVEEVLLDGFQLVRRSYFEKGTEPMLSISNGSLTFNTVCAKALNSCECIQVLVNNKEKKLIITPVTSNESEAVRWKKGKGDTFRLDCLTFIKSLFEFWNYDTKLRYRGTGRVVQSNGKIMVLFDFLNPEIWEGKKMVSKHGE